MTLDTTGTTRPFTLRLGEDASHPGSFCLVWWETDCGGVVGCDRYDTSSPSAARAEHRRHHPTDRITRSHRGPLLIHLSQ